MKRSEDIDICKHCEVVGVSKPATKKVEFFGEEIFLCNQCFKFATEEGLINEETYGVKKKKNRRNFADIN